MSKFSWNETNEAQLVELAGQSPVSQDTLASVADELGTTARSVGAKLRKLGYEVDKAAAKASAWTPAQEAELRALVESNPNAMTYTEIAALFQAGAFSAKQIQGKLLNMELFALVRKADKKAAPRTYTPEEEARFVAMAQEGASIEALAAEFDKTVASVRGKALSLFRAGQIESMPEQTVSTAKKTTDPINDLGDISALTVEEIAERTGKTVRGVKAALSRRGVSCANHDGAAKRAKLDSKAAE